MAGCGGNCQCGNKSEEPRSPVRLADALARVIVDNRVAARAIELYEAGIVDVQDIVVQINLDKAEGRL